MLVDNKSLYILCPKRHTNFFQKKKKTLNEALARKEIAKPNARCKRTMKVLERKPNFDILYIHDDASVFIW